jgi:hypothetical protein
MSYSILIVKDNSPDHVGRLFGTAQKVFCKLALHHLTERANTWANMLGCCGLAERE